jgi:prefoldin subunit 5
MTQPADETLNPLHILARQADAIEQLTTAVELMQRELQALRRRVQELEGVPWPEEPPDPD